EDSRIGKNKTLTRFILLNYQDKFDREKKDYELFKHIEHIAPQDDRYWKGNSIYSEGNLENIGNLVLIPMKENSSLSCRKWNEKRLMYEAVTSKTKKIAKGKIGKLDFKNKTLINLADNGYSLDSLSEICSVKNWNNDSVLKRNKKIAINVGKTLAKNLLK